jgi:hypothetical protein
MYHYKISWHVDPLLGKDSERISYTTAITELRLQKQVFPRQQLDTVTEEVFPARSVPRCYKQGSWSNELVLWP